MSEREPVMDVKQVGLGLFAVLLLFGTGVRVCGKPGHSDEATVPMPDDAAAVGGSVAHLPKAEDQTGLSAPIAAAWTKGGDVFVAGLDVPAKAIRVQRLGEKGSVRADFPVLDDVRWSTDAELKLAASPDGTIALMWHGLRGAKLVRLVVTFGPDGAIKSVPTEVPSASCVTKDGVWFADNAVATSRPWSGEPAKIALPRDKDASLLCAAHRAFGILEEDDKTSVVPLAADAGAPLVMMREDDFKDDDQRELSEYNVGDEIGVVRLAVSGAIAIRETKGGAPGPLHKLKATIGRDDDVVAVDASEKAVVVVFTQEASATCPANPASPSDAPVSTKVKALRVNRDTWEESVAELSPGRCGAEVGPFFTGPLGEDVSVAWVERNSGVGKARAPIAGLAHATVGLARMDFARIDQVADALVDGGCDGQHCWAGALVRREDQDAMTAGYVRVLRW